MIIGLRAFRLFHSDQQQALVAAIGAGVNRLAIIEPEWVATAAIVFAIAMPVLAPSAYKIAFREPDAMTVV